MFVSTVRSRHHVSQMAHSVGEFGFLSEAQLVNTALTRAKSWLAVVGDPVALCSLGNCGSLWRSYLKHCQKVSGIHPTDLSLEDIWQQSQSLMKLLTVKSVTADSEEKVRQAQVARAAIHMSTCETSTCETSTWETSAQLPETVTPSQQLTTHSSQTSSAQPQQPAVNVLQQTNGDIAAEIEMRSIGRVRTTKDTGPQAAYIDRTKVHATQAKSTSEDSSGEEEKSHDMRLRVKSRDMTSAQRVTSCASAVAVNFSEWSLDYQLEPDDILKQLAKVCVHRCLLQHYLMFIL